MALLARHDPDRRAPASPSRSTSHPTSASTLSAVRASKARRSVMTPSSTTPSGPARQFSCAMRPASTRRRGDCVPPRTVHAPDPGMSRPAFAREHLGVQLPEGLRPDAVDPMRTATGHQVPVQCVVPALAVRPARPGPGQPGRSATPESLLGAVISAIRRGQQLLRVVIGHLASSSVVVGHAAPICSAWPPSAWHRGPCPCGHCALPGDAALNHAAYYRHVVAP
jgi:hypothetical protein